MGISLTCFASHQTVAERDLCRVVPIYQWASYLADPAEFRGAQLDVHASRMGWSDTGWHAIGEFFPAVAEEYGRIELRMSAQVRRQVVRLLHHLLSYSPRVVPDNGSSHKAFDLRAFMTEQSPELLEQLLMQRRGQLFAVEYDETFDTALSACFAHVFEAGVHGHLYVADVRGRLRPMEFALIHEDAYQALVERKLTTPRFGRLPVDVKTAIGAAFEKAYESVPDERGDPLTLKFVRAGVVADRLTEMNDLTRDLYLLRGYLTEVASLVFEGTLSVQEATEVLKDDIEGVYAFASLDDLGVPLSPVVYAAEEDYDNHCGSAYLDFVTRVNRNVYRSRQVAIHGEFFRYELHAASTGDLQSLQEDAKSWDCGFELVSAQPVPGDASGLLQVIIEVTAELDYIQRVLEDLNLPNMHESLKLVA